MKKPFPLCFLVIDLEMFSQNDVIDSLKLRYPNMSCLTTFFLLKTLAKNKFQKPKYEKDSYSL